MLMYCAPSGLVGCGGACPCYVFIGLHPMLRYFDPTWLVGCWSGVYGLSGHRATPYAKVLRPFRACGLWVPIECRWSREFGFAMGKANVKGGDL
jgi:hypothetical protein